MSEYTIVNDSGETAKHYKWADPKLLDISIGMEIKGGMIAAAAMNIVCHEEFRTPLVTKKQLQSMNFLSLFEYAKWGRGNILFSSK